MDTIERQAEELKRLRAAHQRLITANRAMAREKEDLQKTVSMQATELREVKRRLFKEREAAARQVEVLQALVRAHREEQRETPARQRLGVAAPARRKKQHVVKWCRFCPTAVGHGNIQRHIRRAHGVRTLPNPCCFTHAGPRPPTRVPSWITRLPYPVVGEDRVYTGRTDEDEEEEDGSED